MVGCGRKFQPTIRPSAKPIMISMLLLPSLDNVRTEVSLTES
jgi:hypothetical protein